MAALARQLLCRAPVGWFSAILAVLEAGKVKTSTSQRSGGVTTVNFVVLGAVLVLALGVAVPVLNDRITAAERAQALGDLRRLAADVLNYQKDTGVWPSHARFTFTDGGPAYGEADCFGGESGAEHISTFLVSNTRRVRNWRGPYMTVSRPDPWRHRYVVVLGNLHGDGGPYGWVLSAGPDGVFQTRKTDPGLCGDDLGLRLR